MGRKGTRICRPSSLAHTDRAVARGTLQIGACSAALVAIRHLRASKNRPSDWQVLGRNHMRNSVDTTEFLI